LCAAGLLLIVGTFLPWFHGAVPTNSRFTTPWLDRGYSGWDLFTDCGSWPGRANQFPGTCSFYAPADDALLPREMITGAWTLVAGSVLVGVGVLVGVRGWRQRAPRTWLTVCAWLAALFAGVVVAGLWAIQQSYLLLTEGGSGGSKSELQFGAVLVSLAPIVAVVGAVLVTTGRRYKPNRANSLPSTADPNRVANEVRA
jgi:hypothetical protein